MNVSSYDYTSLVFTEESAAQRSKTVERPPNDHDLSIALGEDLVVVRDQGACTAASPLSDVVVGLSEPPLLRNSLSAQKRRPA
jgi:hypothetical protein